MPQYADTALPLTAKHTREFTDRPCTDDPRGLKPMLETELNNTIAQAQQVDEEIHHLHSRKKELLDRLRQLKVGLEDKCAQADEVLAKLEDKDLERY